MNSYLITDENRIIRHTLNLRNTNIEYRKGLLKSKSKIDLNKSQKNQKKNTYKKAMYLNQDLINKMRYNKLSNKNYLTQDEIFPTKNTNYNYRNYKQLFTQHNKLLIDNNSHIMNLTSPKNLKLYQQNLLEKVNKSNNNIYTGRTFKTNLSITNINKKREEYKPQRNYNQLQDNIKIYFEGNKRKIASKSNKNKNNINEIMNQINFSNNKNIKYFPFRKNIQNCGNNNTTTNNTFNNNIYYINPIEYTNNKLKKKIELKNANSIYKSVDMIIPKKKKNIIDYYKINNIRKSQRDKYTKAAVLIQSVIRRYLVKIKVFNNLSLYINSKRLIDILQKIIVYKRAKMFLKKLKAFFPYKTLNNRIFSPFYQKRNSYLNLYHKELGDSFNIKGDRNSRKKLEIKVNDLLKENQELKNKISDNKIIKEKIQGLLEENKKIQSINNIILKDNKQLAKRLKDFQLYRKNKLVIQKDIEKMQIHESNDDLISINRNKYAKIILRKILDKKIKEKNIMKIFFEKYKNIINNLKEKEKMNNKLRNIHLKNVLNIIENHFKLLKEKHFYYLYYKSSLIQNKNIIKKNRLKIILLIKEKKRINILYHPLIKILKQNMNNNNNNKIQEIDTLKLRQEKLKSIIYKYISNLRLIYKVYFEKWNLKSKLIGIKAAARDKKRKRKQKKKINKLLYNKHYLVVDNYKHRDYSNKVYPRLSKSIQGFNYIVSDQDIIKDPNMEEGKLIIGNLSTNNIKYIYKKTKSVNKLRVHSEKIGNKEDDVNIKDEKNKEINSDEDSGDSFGLGNNSDNKSL